MQNETDSFLDSGQTTANGVDGETQVRPFEKPDRVQQLTTVFFGRRYRITAPEASWTYLDGKYWCDRCGSTLTFVFLYKTDPDKGYGAAHWFYPCAIKCGCFKNDDGTNRPPIAL